MDLIRTYFGNGILTKDSLIYYASEQEDVQKDINLVESEEDNQTELKASGGTWELICNNTGYGQMGSWWNSAPSCGWAVHLACDAAWNTWGFDTLILHVQDDVDSPAQLTVPTGKTLIIYGGNSALTGDANKRINWIKTGTGGNESCIDTQNKCILEVHNINFYDFTTTNVIFNRAPGCISTVNDEHGFYSILRADRCNFFSNAHWWSVSCGKAGSWVTNCYFNNTTGNQNYGALCIVDGTTVDNCTFDGKKGISSSRAITVASRGTPNTIKNCTMTNYGGLNPAVEIEGSATMTNNTINNGSSYSGENDIAVKNNGTLTMSGNNIYGTTVNGIFNTGTLTYQSGNVYANSKYGVLNSGTFIMTGGSVFSNTQGVWCNASSNTDIHGGSIYSNNFLSTCKRRRKRRRR